jgi:hypothetical protein
MRLSQKFSDNAHHPATVHGIINCVGNCADSAAIRLHNYFHGIALIMVNGPEHKKDSGNSTPGGNYRW